MEEHKHRVDILYIQVNIITRLQNTSTDSHLYIINNFNKLLNVFIRINIVVSGNNFGLSWVHGVHGNDLQSPQVPQWE